MKQPIIYLSLFALALGGCTKDITDFNKNPKAPEEVPASMLFANAQKDLFYHLASPNVNVNTLRLWAQHWTQTTYVDESNYELTERNINGRAYDRLYANVLRDLNEARKLVEADDLILAGDKSVQLAMIDVLECYAYHVLVDIFNDVPYTDAIKLIDGLAPKYDAAATIYQSLIARLKAAGTALSSGGSTGDFGSSDNMYGGDADNWAAFAHSLRLKLAIRTGNAAEAADASAGAFTSSAQDAVLAFEGAAPNTNPLWEDLVQSGRFDFICSGTLADMMNSLNDPRRPLYFKNLDSLGNLMAPPHGQGSAYNNNSQPGTKLENPSFPSQILTYYEVEFLRAHLAAMNSDDVNAAMHYDNAIHESIYFWGGSQVDADAYALQATVDYAAQKLGGKTWKEIIGTQKWIAMYNNGFEAWSTWRVYDYPQMQVAAEAGTVPPTRWNYSVDEYSVNATNVGAANGGSDIVTGKVFWDN